MNTWPGNKHQATHQNEHEEWNTKHYPGTLPLCSYCDQPTDRCEDNTIWSEDDEPLCDDGYHKTNVHCNV